MLPAAGKYDPIQASFYAPVETRDSTTKEVVISYPTATFRRYIRFMRVIGREGTTTDQVISSSQCTVRLRSDPATVLIKADWKVVHNSRTYGIVAVNPIPHNMDEVELLLDSIIR
jgi:hypothetical protein